MSDLMEIKQNEKSEETKRKGISPIVAQDIIAAYNPNARVTSRLLVADNQFYSTVNTIVGKKSYSFMPYIMKNPIFHADGKFQCDISNRKIKLSPYNLLEGACIATKQMYNRFGIQIPQKIDYRFLIHTYYIYTSLCVIITPNCDISLITANPSVLSQLPLIKHNAEGVKRRISMQTDDVVNEIIQCVELAPSVAGYEVKPAIINAGGSDCAIIPKAWIDYLICSINRMLLLAPCKITYLSPSNKPITIVACNKYDKGVSKRNITLDYINKQPNKYGVIRCVDCKTGALIAFPITHFVTLSLVKGV